METHCVEATATDPSNAIDVSKLYLSLLQQGRQVRGGYFTGYSETQVDRATNKQLTASRQAPNIRQNSIGPARSVSSIT